MLSNDIADVVLGAGTEDLAESLCSFHTLGGEAVAGWRFLAIADEVECSLSHGIDASDRL